MLDGCKLRHLIAAGLGRLAASVRYHRVDFVDRDGLSFCRKRRRWFSRPLLFVGNLMLVGQRAGVQILAAEPWRCREEQLWRKLYGQQVLASAGALYFPVLPGERLDYWLRGSRTLSERLRAVTSASLALTALHELESCSEHDPLGIASHGDAVVANVLYDPTTNRSMWLDFETQHHPTLPRAWRFADDLRALLCSAAECCSDIAVPSLVNAVLCHQRDAEVLGNLLELLDREVSRPCSYHAAQANLGFQQLHTLLDEVAKWSQDRCPPA